MKSFFVICFLLLLVSACGVKHIAPSHPSLRPVPETGEPEPLRPTSVAPSVDSAKLQSPCELWDRLPEAQEGSSEAFTVLADYNLVRRKKGHRRLYEAYGQFNLALTPQLQWALSGEVPDPATGRPSRRKKVDPPNLEEFMALAKQKKDNDELGGFKLFVLKLKYKLHQRKSLLKIRNRAMSEELEKKLPGVLSGKAGPLENAELMLDYKQSLGVTKLGDDVFPLLKILTKRTPLFISNDWNDRRHELAQSLATLEKSSADAGLPKTEKTCRFYIAQRLTGQLIALKGISQAPRLQPNGTLLPLPTQEYATYPEYDLAGAYAEPLTVDSIEAQIARPTLRAIGAETSLGLIQHLRYLAELTRPRSPFLWATNEEIQNRSTPEGTLKLPAELLKMGLGLFAFNSKTLADTEIVHGAGERLSFVNDSPEALAMAGQLAMEAVDSLQSLNEPNDLEQRLLDRDQLDKMLAPYPDGMIARYKMLVQGVAFEGLQRMSEGERSPVLIQTLQTIGRRLNNARLIEVR